MFCLLTLSCHDKEEHSHSTSRSITSDSIQQKSLSQERLDGYLNFRIEYHERRRRKKDKFIEQLKEICLSSGMDINKVKNASYVGGTVLEMRNSVNAVYSQAVVVDTAKGKAKLVLSTDTLRLINVHLDPYFLNNPEAELGDFYADSLSKQMRDDVLGQMKVRPEMFKGKNASEIKGMFCVAAHHHGLQSASNNNILVYNGLSCLWGHDTYIGNIATYVLFNHKGEQIARFSNIDRRVFLSQTGEYLWFDCDDPGELNMDIPSKPEYIIYNVETNKSYLVRDTLSHCRELQEFYGGNMLLWRTISENKGKWYEQYLDVENMALHTMNNYYEAGEKGEELHLVHRLDQGVLVNDSIYVPYIDTNYFTIKQMPYEEIDLSNYF